ncbi:MAG: FumA C-terminus/TtdB family hydratase beta subunit [Thermodesulfobacteriota bacterium]|nr:FumA C-terminus/TtdB family hydratase beta subunit [Thermodesulfobacteriota bacterium]
MTEYRVKTPVSEEEARKLKIGDVVYINGRVHVWRDRAYDYISEILRKGGKIPEDLKGSVHWHCGPITKKVEDRWIVISAGSTTSKRFNEKEPVAIGEWGVKLVIGKGLGMGEKVSQALKEYGAAYLSAVGGAASYYGKKVKEVKAVYWLELGMPEAMWVFEVEDLGPLQVSMDSYGGNLYEDVRKQAYENLLKAYHSIGIN